MDREPVPLGDIVDAQMLRILGPAGFDSYKVLCGQTAATRERIATEVRGRYPEFLAAAVRSAQATGRQERADRDALLARMEAERLVQEEIGRRVSEEDAAFRARCQNLFAWTQGK